MAQSKDWLAVSPELSPHFVNSRSALAFLVSLLMLLVPGVIAKATAQPLPTKAEANDARSVLQVERPLLVLNQPISHQLSPGEARGYGIQLRRGQYLRVVVTKQDARLALNLSDPAHRPQTELQSDRYGALELSLVAQVSGLYGLDVRSLEPAPQAPSSYTVTLVELRRATTTDQLTLRAERAFAAAERLRPDWTQQSLSLAIKQYEAAGRSWRAAGQRRAAARAYNSIGEIYFLLTEYKKALAPFQQALSLRRQAGDGAGEIDTLNNVGYVHIYLGDKPNALKACEQAHQLSVQQADRYGEAKALNHLGKVYYFSGEMPRSIEFYQRALPIWREVKDRRGEALTIINLGYSYFDLREMPQALEYYQQALTLWRATGERRGEAAALTAIGGVHSYLGEKQLALDYHQQAVDYFRLMGNRTGEAATLNGIGAVYESLGELKKALAAYRRALFLVKSVGNREFESITTLFVGRAHHLLGEQQAALAAYNQVLSLSRVVTYRMTKATALNYLGLLYHSQQDWPKALHYYRQALSVYQAVADRQGEASALNNLGYTYEQMGQPQASLAFYNDSLKLSQTIADYGGEALARHNLARVYRDLNRLGEGREQSEAALKLIESLRTKVVSQQLRTSYFASIQQYYELHVDLLLRLHQQQPTDALLAAALQANERARARSLLESLTEARANIREGVEPALVKTEQELQRLLNDKAERQMRLLSSPTAGAARAELAKEIDALTAQLETIRTQIKLRSPRYAALTQPQPLTVSEIQQQVLDEQTLLLEYALGEVRSYLWAVTPTSIASYELPGRAVIEQAARRVYELLIARQAIPGETAQQHRRRYQAAAASYDREALALSQILFGQVAAHLGTKRLLIVADGALQYVPLGALPVPPPDSKSPDADSARPSDHPPLLLKHEIVYLSSASVLAVLRQEAHARPAPTKEVLVLADPVFEPDDPRLPGQSAQGRTPLRTAQRARGNSSGGLQADSSLHRAWRTSRRGQAGLSLPRLPATGREAQAIMSVASPESSLLAVGVDANRALVLSPELGHYRIVHFATHGLLNPEYPDLSGLVLSLLDSQRQPQKGFLRLHDIYNLRLTAELVVLSACDTGLGQEIKGEGLLGLTRGFMYAGAPRVISSLWQVDDAATAELMRRFYQHLLKDKQSAAAALRAAQLEIWQQQEWRAPYYWAAFVLQGEWR